MKKLWILMSLILLIGNVSAQQITQYEYWTDSDFAGRSVVTLGSPAADATIAFQYATASLTDGLHSLNTRFKDANGKWSCVQTDYFIKSAALGPGTNTVTDYEYWYDSDFSGRISSPIGSPSEDVILTQSLDVALLSDGIHALNMRFKDASGQWSCVQTDYFFKSAALGPGTNMVTDYEYWYDSDFSSRISYPVGSPSEDILLTQSLDVASLSDGIHALNMRFKDASGHWSCVQTDYFMKTLTSGTDSNVMVAYEYWIDSTFAARISGLTSAVTDIIFIDSIDVTSLVEGYHTINFRFKDAIGQWSCVQSDTFKRCSSFYEAPVISGNVSICAGQNLNLSAQSSDSSTINFFWTGPDNYSYTGDTLQILNATTAKSGTYYCTAIRGTTLCDTSIVTAIDVVVNPLPVAAITGVSSVCAGDSTWLVATGGSTYLWNNSTVNDSLLIKPTAYTTYYVTVTSAAGCVSTKSKSVSIKALPNVVISPVSATICQGASQTLTASGASTYVWSDGTTTPKDTVSPLVTTTYSVIGTATNGCNKSASVIVVVNPLPASAGVISGIDSVCPGQNSVTYTIPAIADAASYVWTLPAGATGTSSTNSITVNYSTSAASGNLSVKGSNSCGDGEISTLDVYVYPLPESAGTISGLETVCQGQNSVTYTVPVIANATSYNWTLPGGATGTSTTNSITVDYSTSAVSGDLAVYGSNDCGNGSITNLAIVVNALPENAGAISGLNNVCKGQNSVTYTVPVIANATSYNWTLPGGATGTSTTNSITVDYSTSAVSGDLTVYGTNTCGDGSISSLAIVVNALPENAGAISGLNNVCQGQNSMTYTVPVITNATSYNWTLPGGATGTSTTNSITVDYSTSAVSGDITVYGSSVCGDGSISSLAIVVNALPENAGAISGLNNVCQGQNSVTYTVPVIADATSYNWTLPGGATGTSTTNSITVDYSTSAVSGVFTVYGSNACGDGSISSLAIVVNALPENAGAISGLNNVCQGQNSVTYTVPVIADATSYNWTLPGGATGTSTTNSITVDYSLSAVSGDLTVYGSNACGSGSSNSLAIVVSSLPETAGAISGLNNVCQGQNSLTYTVPAITNATSYNWTLPGGATGTSTTNSMSVGDTLSAVSGDLTVYGNNACGNGSSNSLAIVVNLLPETAGAISGLNNVCTGQNSVTYTVPAIANATSYNWTLPGGATGTSATNSITVDYSPSAVSGDLTVYGSNACGNGSSNSLAIVVSSLPETAGAISGLNNVCQGQTSVTYTVPVIANATSYNWTLPGGATGTSTTNSISVDYTLSAVSGDLTVYGSNSCGDGAFSTYAVTVNNKPPAPVISQIGNVLHSDAPLGNQWYDQNGIINGAVNQDYSLIVDGDYYAIVTLNGCSSDISNVISIITTDIELFDADNIIKVYPNPFSNEFTIESEGNSEMLNFEIFNAIGNIVFKGNLMDKTSVQTSDFASGVYLIKFDNGKTIKFKKIIKE